MSGDRALRDELEQLQSRVRELKAQLAAGVDEAAVVQRYEALLGSLEAQRASLVQRRATLAKRVDEAEVALGASVGRRSQELDTSRNQPPEDALEQAVGGVVGLGGAALVLLPLYLLTGSLSPWVQGLAALGPLAASAWLTARRHWLLGRAGW